MSQEQLNHVVVGVLNDFIIFLTTRKERIVLSASDDASPAVDAIREFLKKKGVVHSEPLWQWVGRCERTLSTPPEACDSDTD